MRHFALRSLTGYRDVDGLRCILRVFIYISYALLIGKEFHSSLTMTLRQTGSALSGTLVDFGGNKWSVQGTDHGKCGLRRCLGYTCYPVGRVLCIVILMLCGVSEGARLTTAAAPVQPRTVRERQLRLQ